MNFPVGRVRYLRRFPADRGAWFFSWGGMPGRVDAGDIYQIPRPLTLRNILHYLWMN